jgi:hypothetical protein
VPLPPSSVSVNARGVDVHGAPEARQDTAARRTDRWAGSVAPAGTGPAPWPPSRKPSPCAGVWPRPTGPRSPPTSPPRCREGDGRCRCGVRRPGCGSDMERGPFGCDVMGPLIIEARTLVRIWKISPPQHTARPDCQMPTDDVAAHRRWHCRLSGLGRSRQGVRGRSASRDRQATPGRVNARATASVMSGSRNHGGDGSRPSSARSRRIPSARTAAARRRWRSGPRAAPART